MVSVCISRLPYPIATDSAEAAILPAREGLVAEIDVFNLRDNVWETDWKGLDQGELEIPPGMSGGTTIVIQGGDGIQSIRPGEGILVSGDRRNPTVSANIQAIVHRIVTNETFKTEIASTLAGDAVFQSSVAWNIIENIATAILNNTEVLNQIITSIINNEELIETIITNIVNHETLLENIVPQQ